MTRSSALRTPRALAACIGAAIAAVLLLSALAAPALAADLDLGMSVEADVKTVSTDMGKNPAGKTGFYITPTDAGLAVYQQAGHAGATTKDMVADWASHITSVTVNGTTLTSKSFNEWKNELTTAAGDAGKLNYYQLSPYSTRALISLPIALFDTAQETSSRLLVIQSEGFATVSGTVTYRNLGADELVVRLLDGQGNVKSSSVLSLSDLQKLNIQDRHDSSANCGMAGIRSYCSQGVLLTDVLAAAGINFGPGMTVKMRVNDELEHNGDANTTEDGYFENATFSYETLIGTTRYHYPAMWDDTPRSELGGRSIYSILSQNKDAWKMGDDATVLAKLLGETKVETKAVIAWQWNEGVVAWEGSNPSAKEGYNGYCDQARFRLLYGMKANEDGSAADDNTTFSNTYAIFGIDVVADGDYRLFDDVDPDSWYGQAVSYVYSKGVMSGYSGTRTFGVGDTLTRAQIATMMWRIECPDEAAAYVAEGTRNATGLPDVEDNAWYTGAANWALANGVMTGYTNADGSATFDPNGTATFEQLITIIARAAASGDYAVDTNAVLSAFADAGSIDAWARDSLAWAVSNGLIEGYAEGDARYLGPLQDVKRERAAVVFFNGLNWAII